MTSDLLFNVLSVLIPIVAITVVSRAVRQGSYMSIGAIDTWSGSFLRDIKRGDNVIFSASFIGTVLKGFTYVLRLTVVIVPLLVVFLPLLYRWFPFTEQLVNAIFGAALERLKMLSSWLAAFAPIIVFWLVMAVAAYFLIKLARLFFDEVAAGSITLPGFNKEWSYTTYQLVKVGIIVAVLIAIYSLTPGSNTPTIQAIILLTTLLAGLGAKDIVTDIVSGLVLTYSGAFDIGDKVRIGDITGKVRATSLLTTVVHTTDKKEVSIPNKDILGTKVENYSKVASALIEIDVIVGYSVPWRQVQTLLLDAAQATPGVVLTKPGYEPGVLQTGFGKFHVNYVLYAYIDRPRSYAWQVRTPLRQNIQDRFNEANVPLGVPLSQFNQLSLEEED